VFQPIPGECTVLENKKLSYHWQTTRCV